MALTPTIYTYDITLSDVDRDVYESFSIRVACHPSETAEFMLARVFGYCLEYAPGIEFANSISAPDLPAIAIRDLTGVMTLWLDVGMPDGGRLHKASKTGARVVVYTHKDPLVLKRQLQKTRIHRVEELLLFALDRVWLAELAKVIERRNRWEVSVSDREIYVTVGGKTIAGSVVEHRVTEA